MNSFSRRNIYRTENLSIKTNLLMCSTAMVEDLKDVIKETTANVTASNVTDTEELKLWI